MPVLTFVSLKKGSGASTLAGHIAVQADLNGAGRVGVIDGDPDGDLALWAGARGAAEPAFAKADHGRVASEVQRLQARGSDLVVLSIPSAAAPGGRDAIAAADLVVIPTRPDNSHLSAVAAAVEAVEAEGRPFVFVVHGVRPDAELTGAAAVALAQYGTVCPVIVSERPDFAVSMRDGGTVMEVDARSEAAGEIAQLWDYLSHRLSRFTQAAERRRHPRWVLDEPATLSVDGKDIDCSVNDISAGGVSVYLHEPPRVGTRVVIHVPKLGRFDAEVRNATSDRAGLMFVTDDEARSDLVRQLSEMIEANGDAG